jgi:hypothetical protein
MARRVGNVREVRSGCRAEPYPPTGAAPGRGCCLRSCSRCAQTVGLGSPGPSCGRPGKSTTRSCAPRRLGRPDAGQRPAPAGLGTSKPSTGTCRPRTPASHSPDPNTAPAVTSVSGLKARLTRPGRSSSPDRSVLLKLTGTTRRPNHDRTGRQRLATASHHARNNLALLDGPAVGTRLGDRTMPIRRVGQRVWAGRGRGRGSLVTEHCLARRGI